MHRQFYISINMFKITADNDMKETILWQELNQIKISTNEEQIMLKNTPKEFKRLYKSSKYCFVNRFDIKGFNYENNNKQD